jgi:hypothetical protein
MKRLLALGALTAAAVALPASPAIADAPPGQGLETFTVECAEGTITVVGTPGDSASRWVDGQHMVLLSITFGADGVTIKTYGQKRGPCHERCQLHGDGPVRHRHGGSRARAAEGIAPRLPKSLTDLKCVWPRREQSVRVSLGASSEDLHLPPY